MGTGQFLQRYSLLCNSIRIEAVGESVVALYGKKSYTGAIVELGKLKCSVKKHFSLAIEVTNDFKLLDS